MVHIKFLLVMCATAAGSRNLAKKNDLWLVSVGESSNKKHLWLGSGAKSSKKTINFRLESGVELARIKQFSAGKLHRSG